MIDWDSIPDRYTYAARDSDGKWCVYTAKPSISEGRSCKDQWVLNNASENFEHITCALELPWKESLLKRSEGSPLTFENLFKL